MNITEQEVLNLLTTQRLSNENFQLRDAVQGLSAQVAALQKELQDLQDKE